jgi:hypothetical protein
MYGPVAVVDSRFEVPLVVLATDGGQTVSIYRSPDGATFAPLDQPPLHIPAKYDGDTGTGAILGNVIWQQAAEGRTYESTDSGRGWTTTVAPLTPYPLSLINARTAIGVASNSGCLSGKTNCFSYRYPVVTNDSGRTWQDTF